MYTKYFHQAGALSLASGALLGWLIALHRTNPGAIKKLGIRNPHQILRLHLDQIMMGVILLSSGTAFPDLPDRVAGPLLIGTLLNPLGFVPTMFAPSSDQTMAFKAAAGFSFAMSTVGFVGMAWHAVSRLKA